MSGRSVISSAQAQCWKYRPDLAEQTLHTHGQLFQDNPPLPQTVLLSYGTQRTTNTGYYINYTFGDWPRTIRTGVSGNFCRNTYSAGRHECLYKRRQHLFFARK
jgi:hypothetical protein